MSAETVMPQNVRVNKCCTLWKDKMCKSMTNRHAFVGNTATCQHTVDTVSSALVLFFYGTIILTLQLDLSFTKEVCHFVVVAFKPQYLTKGL